MSSPRLAFSAALLSALCLGACGGNVVTAPIASPNEIITTSTTAATAFPAATLDGITVNVVFPPTSVATAIMVRISLRPFPGIPAKSHSRVAQDAIAPPELYIDFLPALPIAIDRSIAVAVHEPLDTSRGSVYLITPNDLPLLDLLRPVPTPAVPLTDLLEPTTRVLIDTGYGLTRELNLPPAGHA